MKKNQFTLMAVTFISGIIIGVSALTLYSFANAGPAPIAPSPVKISVQDANALYRAYNSRTTPTNAVFKGFSITKEHLAALNSLLTDTPGLAGFRVYMGYDNTSNVGIIVGTNASDVDVTTSIYRVAAGSSGPCPPVCDVNSPITYR